MSLLCAFCLSFTPNFEIFQDRIRVYSEYAEKAKREGATLSVDVYQQGQQERQALSGVCCTWSYLHSVGHNSFRQKSHRLEY